MRVQRSQERTTLRLLIMIIITLCLILGSMRIPCCMCTTQIHNQRTKKHQEIQGFFFMCKSSGEEETGGSLLFFWMKFADLLFTAFFLRRRRGRRRRKNAFSLFVVFFLLLCFPLGSCVSQVVRRATPSWCIYLSSSWQRQRHTAYSNFLFFCSRALRFLPA